MLVILGGVGVDVAAHAGPLASPGWATTAHWIVLAGMAIALVGAVRFGLRQRGG
ncbi:MAG TPA: hypothetical protein VHH92_07880 [Actinomycetota bacterium]|nr:hypothetical protein [Actinomycetota bacterium]